MKTNFVLNDDSVSVQTGDQYFDLHNCFDLSGLEIDFAKKQVTLLLTSSDVTLMNKSPKTLRLLFSEVDFCYVSNGTTEKMVRDIAELGYKRPNDFDHNWLVNEKNKSPDDHLFIRLAGDEFIRVHGETAKLTYE